MNPQEVEDFFRSQWAATVKACVNRMEPYDRRTLRSFRTLEDIQVHVIDEPESATSDRALQELAMFRPRLMDLKVFSDFYATKLGPALDTSAFWGLLGLLLAVAQPYDEAIVRVIQMLKKLGGKCQLIYLYSSLSSTPNKEEKEICFEIFILLTNFFADMVQFFRKAGDISVIPHSGEHDQYSWQKLLDIFTRIEKDIDDGQNRLEKLAAVRGGQDNASRLSSLSLVSRSFHDTAQLPCFVLPPARGSRFFDRDDVIEKIEEHFQDLSSCSLSSLALYGMGGVGKSHVALKYAEKKQGIKELDAIFWVEGETAVSMTNSFTNIALRLKLSGTCRDTQIENLIIVKEWLQQTGCRWLMIYDNVEDFDLLRDYWPLPGSKGLVLITTRNHSLAFEPADTGIEVTSWDTETGSKFLLHILSRYISADILANESKSAYDLSERLSGHALALSNMCGLIHRRSWTISELLEVYDRTYEFKDGLDVVWNLSFQSLRPDSAALLSFFSFCSPDSILHAMLELDSKAELPSSLEWYRDEDRLSEAIETLLTLALVKRDRSTRTFSIHRLIQTHYRRFMTKQDRQKAFCDASTLLYNIFPKRSTTLYDTWEQCQRWLPHVLSLKESFRRERQRDPEFHACIETCLTWTSCQHFLLEQNNWSELEDLVNVNKLALGTLPSQDPDLWMLSATESHCGQMFSRQARYRIALGSLLTTCDIKLAAPQVDLKTLTWAQDNVAVNYNCMLEFESALEWHARSRATWVRFSEKEGIELRIPSLITLSHGRTLAYAQKFEEARSELNKAMEEFMADDPLNWGLAAACKFALGRLLMFEQNYEAAEGDFVESQNLWLLGDKSRFSDFNGAAMYRIGCCGLLQGDVDAALKHVQDAMFVTSMRRDIMVGEHARCLFKMSEILYQIPGRELEADKLLQEAEQLYRKKVGMPEVVEGIEHDEQRILRKELKEEDYDALVFIYWR